jgi:hypothetical protein
MKGDPPLWLRRAVPISLGLLLLVGVAGFAIGANKPSTTMRTALIYSSGSISSMPIDGWTYGIPLDVAWTDASGSYHDHGRPDCLPPAIGLIGPITFATVEASAGGVSWRPVVWVSCRP